MGSYTKPWADGPFELLRSSRVGSVPGEAAKGVAFFAEEMLTVHNVLLRGINSIYLQAVNVEKSDKDVPDFVEYALQWLKFIEEHHSGEENDVFPRIDAQAGVPGLMQGNIDQHKAFHDGLDAMESFLEDVRDGEQNYNGQKLKDIIDSFMPVLRQHLSDEIDTLLGLEKYKDKCDWEAFFKAITAEIMKKANDPNIKYTTLPMVVSNHDKTFENGVYAAWPQLPWVVLLLTKWVFAPKHKNWWRFAPVDIKGNPRELPFA